MGRLRILVIDDEPHVRSSLRMVLEMSGTPIPNLPTGVNGYLAKPFSVNELLDLVRGCLSDVSPVDPGPR
jgi:DNA-binding response OmpR family regulator